uniref:Fras1 related extracellular matrix 1a n=1 Tax=Eptatretus burgeri TaxID=7764 RepID=A0A8C4Q9K8_EPTBU
PQIFFTRTLGLASRSVTSFVLHNSGISVPRGREVFVDPDALRISAPSSPNDPCRVEIVKVEAISQRVGKLTPVVFDCYFKAREVKYTHNGSPLLDEDRVLLRLFRFTDLDTYVESFWFHVSIVATESSSPGPAWLGDKLLQVSSFLSVSGPLNAEVLHINPLGSSSSASTNLNKFCLILSHAGLRPKSECEHARCEVLKTNHFSCDHFLHIGLRYEHLGASSPDVDYVPISVELSDTYGSLIEAKRLWLPVHIDNAGPNHRPIVTSFSDLDVDQFVLTPLTTNSLDAQDEETPRDHLKFALTQPPDFGFFTHLDDHTKPIKSFSRKDLSNLLIAYQPPNASSPERRSFKAEFMAYDAYFAYSSPIILYITIRTTDTNAPRVSWNAGLDLLEGQSRPLTRDIFQVVDNDNLAAVRIMAVAGLNHGKFTVRGGRRFMFSVQDIVEGVVRYHHDDSDTTSDYVVLRITDGQHSIRHKFPIHIVPKDDSPPFLLNHLALELCKGETVTLTSVLKASDTDSRDELIKFTVMKPPQEGRLLLKTRHNTLVTSFRQHDLLMGKISYHHLGGDKTQDSFEFFLNDSHEPPNHSDKQVMIIHIIPLDDKIPTEVPGTMRNMVVNETDVDHVLHYHSVSHPCTTRVIILPYASSSTETSGLNSETLYGNSHAVNHFKVAYMPPIKDIGPNSILVQFGFMVTDEHGGTLHEQFFNITVLPVDNQMPEVMKYTFLYFLPVAEGDAALLLPRHIMVKDPDTIPGNLRVLISKNPLHGSLEMDGVILFEGDSIALDHIVARRIRYQHDGSETLQDDVALTVTDRTNSVDVLLHFKITPVNDEPPMLISGLEATLSCLEGGNAVITPSHLFAKDADSEESRLLFMVARPPSYGLVLHNGTSTDHFMQSDIEASTITYIHTGGEIGLRPSYDHVTIIISDAEAGGGEQRARSSLHLLPVYDLNITILPVDNQPPKLIIGDVLVVEETSKVALQRTHIWATDTDTHPDQLELMLVSPPRHGYLEDIRPLLGHERSNAGLSIGVLHLLSTPQTVNYVQSRHKGTESTADIMLLYASDGIRRSKELSLHVVIKPINDEVPTLLVQNITVVEGEMKKLGPSLLNAEDADMPPDSLTFTFVKPPSNGAIMGSYQGQSNQPLITVVLGFCEMTGLEVIYVHDDSDSTTDAFSVSLSDGKHEVYGTVNVTVIPVNDELPIVTRNTGLEIEPGDERVISSATLEASDKDSARYDVLFILTDEPMQGQLELKVGAEWKALALGANFSQDDVDENRVRYVHSGRPSANTEDLFRFRLWDGNNQSPVYPFLLIIFLTGEIELLSKPMMVGFGDRTTLSPNLLSAWDGSGRPDKLLFVVRRPPVHGTLEHVAHRGLPISTFTQLDLIGHTVCYAHEGVSRALTNDTISFFVSNGHSSQNGSMSIIVETQDNASPVVERNEGLHVSKGSNAAISSKSLRLGDPGKSSGDLNYLVTELPLHGTLYLHGDPLVGSYPYPAEDLNQQRVVYQHDGSASSLDRFSFVATDSVKCGPVQRSRIKATPVMFKIQVSVKIKTANSVRSLRDGRFGIVLSTRHLMVTDSPNADHEITFSIVRPPTFGYLEHIDTGEIVQTRFTQKDLEERNIVYVINPELDVTSDSLEFELSDAIRSSVNTHTYWSRVQMGTASMRVCENDGSVKIPLIRQGCASDSAFIAIRVVIKLYSTTCFYITRLLLPNAISVEHLM